MEKRLTGIVVDFTYNLDKKDTSIIGDWRRRGMEEY